MTLSPSSFRISAICMLLFLFPEGSSGLSVSPQQQHASVRKSQLAALDAVPHNNGKCDNTVTSRRNMLWKSAGIMFLGSTSHVLPAIAAEEAGKTIYLTGKAPKVPGQKVKDKNDLSGTKKDPNFLRSISDCKTQCENSRGADGYAKTKEDCLSECQDICCTTYEQCTFAIVPRI